MQINDLINRVEALEGGETIARDLRKFINKRKLGLVYEESKPEYVRLVGKPVVEEDLVNVLPPRGTMEDMSGDDDADVIWFVESIDDDKAHLVALEGNDSCDAAYDDLVAVARFDQTIYCGLTETGRVERGGDKPYHTVINGENYHALELLLFPYLQSVDCIYIDPPYNTGAKDWKYNNNYVAAEDTYRHSKWLTFMEDRLSLAKKLLNPKNSVLVCTIDEKEYLRLGLLLEQMFPEAHIQMVSIVINPNGVARESEMYRLEEYAFFVYLGSASPSMVEDTLFTSDIEAQKQLKTSQDGNTSGAKKRKVRWEWLLRGGSNSNRSHSPGCFYPVYIDPDKRCIVDVGEPLSEELHPSDVAPRDGLVSVWPIARGTGTEKVWQMSAPNLRRLVEQGYAKVGAYDRNRDRWTLLYLGKNQRSRIERGELTVVSRDMNSVVTVEESSSTVVLKYPKTIWNRQAHNAGEYGSRLIRAMLPERIFSYPKSLYAVEDTLRTVVKDRPDAIVVDFFAGSGTTAHAVMRLNHQDGGHRRSISITNNEVGYTDAKRFVKRGLRQGDDEWEAFGIARYITIPRVTAAITGDTPEGAPLSGNYKFIDEFPMADGFEENAIFYDLKYLEPSVITANLAFDEIAPLLWMHAGSVGPMVKLGDVDPEDATFEVTDTYGVLFDYAYSPEFIEECRAKDVGYIFVVTDIDRQYRDMCAEFRGKDVKQLYKSYLRTFEIGQDR